MPQPQRFDNGLVCKSSKGNNYRTLCQRSEFHAQEIAAVLQFFCAGPILWRQAFDGIGDAAFIEYGSRFGAVNLCTIAKSGLV